MDKKPAKKTTIHQKILQMQEDIGRVYKNKTKGLMYPTVQHWDITSAVKKVALEQKVLIIPYVKTSQHEGNDTWLTVAIQIIDTETGDQLVVGDYLGQGRDTQDKGAGKAASYAIKTAFMKIFLMEEPDDTESENDQMISTKIMEDAIAYYDPDSKEEALFLYNNQEDISRFKSDYRSIKKAQGEVPDRMQKVVDKLTTISNSVKEATTDA